ncbi:hypothetical protein DFP72DRAFT_848053 [Ephemerocybe angulata]|uniref:Uncharacterized protein n=1 Tax=Ephemerocybe angulata TaxID=980116 RepID=A0A8H6HZJ0_9AGAR|nr:hypothetical protein DFP72DRAFT_848053 [Tulosesus angulatus]
MALVHIQGAYPYIREVHSYIDERRRESMRALDWKGLLGGTGVGGIGLGTGGVGERKSASRLDYRVYLEAMTCILSLTIRLRARITIEKARFIQAIYRAGRPAKCPWARSGGNLWAKPEESLRRTLELGMISPAGEFDGKPGRDRGETQGLAWIPPDAKFEAMPCVLINCSRAENIIGYGVTANIAASHEFAAARGSIPRTRIFVLCHESGRALLYNTITSKST